MTRPTEQSPQELQRCACQSWSTARDCVCQRYNRTDLLEEDTCECICHDDDELEEDDT